MAETAQRDEARQGYRTRRRRQDAEAETETEERAGGAGYPTAQFTGAARATSVGVPVSAGPAPAKDGHGAETETEERAGGAGYPTAQFTGAAPAASVGGPVSAGPAPAEYGDGATGSGETQREEGGDETPRSAREERDPTYGETEERDPLNGRARLTRAANEGGKGEREPPPSSAGTP